MRTQTKPAQKNERPIELLTNLLPWLLGAAYAAFLLSAIAIAASG